MKTEQIISDLMQVEAMCDSLKQKAYSTRKRLERFYAQPAPGAKSKKIAEALVTNFRMSLSKKQSK